MKKEIHPAVIVAALVLILGGLVAGFMLQGRGSSDKVDIKTLSPEELQDPEPARRGDPGYSERTSGNE